MAIQFKAGDSAPFAEGHDNHPDGVYGCILCGRKVGKNPWWVEVVEGGYLRAQDGTEVDEDTDPGYMGFWTVGSECAKKVDPVVLVKLPENF